MKRTTPFLLTAALLTPLSAAALASAVTQGDEILRERRDKDPHVAEKDAAEGGPPPALPQDGWRNAGGRPVQLEEYAGKVVCVLYFDGRDARSRRLVQQLDGLVTELQDAGVVLLGVHAPEGGDRLDDLLIELGLRMPALWDRDGSTAEAWLVDDRPDAWILGRDGNVRVADAADGALGTSIQKVLRESPPTDASPAPPATPIPGRVRALVDAWPQAVYAWHLNGERIATQTLRNAIQPAPGADAGVPDPEAERLVLEDELIVTMHDLRIETRARCVYAILPERVRLLESTVTYRGAPTGDADGAFERTPEAGRFVVRGETLEPRFPFLTDVFLSRAPALTAVDHDPKAKRSWMNYVDGRLYDGVFLAPRRDATRAVLGEERVTRRWSFDGQGQAAPTDLYFDEHGMLLEALLERTVAVTLERAPERSEDAPAPTEDDG